jgi:hypothetical protein
VCTASFHKSSRVRNSISVNDAAATGAKVNPAVDARIAGDMAYPAVLMLVIADSHPVSSVII